MKENICPEELIKKLKELYIKSYETLFIDNDYKTSNKLVKQYVKIEKQLVLTSSGIISMSSLLNDKNEIVRYYSAAALISIFPERCIKILKQIENSDAFLSVEVKYVIANYTKGINYIQKFLAEHNKDSK